MKLRNVSALPRGPGGLVVYLDLLAPYVLLYDLCVLNHVLADPNLFLGHRTLLHHYLFLGEGDTDLVFAYLGLGGLTLYGHPLYCDLFVAGGDLYLLALGAHGLSYTDLSGLALAGARP
jgi:hypothetical protein